MRQEDVANAESGAEAVVSHRPKAKPQAPRRVPARDCLVDGGRQSNGGVVIGTEVRLRRLHSAPDAINPRRSASRFAPAGACTHQPCECVHRQPAEEAPRDSDQSSSYWQS
jgi:hypothetical protein